MKQITVTLTEAQARALIQGTTPGIAGDTWYAVAVFGSLTTAATAVRGADRLRKALDAKGTQ